MTIAADIDALWQAHHRAVKNYIAYRVDRDLVEDILQDVYLRALCALIRGVTPETPRGWLIRIAHNLVIDHYRARSSALPTVDMDAIAFDDAEEGGTRSNGEMEIAPTPTPHELAERSMLCQKVQHAIDGLSGEQPYVVRRRMDGYEFGEIAAELGKSFEAAKQSNVRAWRNLRVTLQEVA